MDPTRVLVVEDSQTIRKYIVEILETTPGFEVAGEAGDGKAAIELCERLAPDVISMDMMLPVMTGLSATEYIMAYCPTPILVVSASTNRGELFRTYDALAAGAVDVLEKPSGSEPDDAWARQLVEALRLVSRVRVITHLRGRLGPTRHAASAALASVPLPGTPTKPARVVAIGASTGGPGAVLDLLSTLPSGFALPILLVIHIAEPFAQAMAEWLAAQTGIPVRYARHDEALSRAAQVVLMAPPGRHLQLNNGRLRLDDGPERHSCKPSVDVLFESLAREAGEQTIACLLTGMGKDGAAGMLAVRAAGGLTIAQDEATSVVWGMPGEAVALGAASHVLPLRDIGSFLAAVPRASREVVRETKE